MIPDPDDYDSEREWAIAASERYVSSFAAERDLDPGTLGSPEITQSLLAVHFALLDQARSARQSESPPPTATSRMPGATDRPGTGSGSAAAAANEPVGPADGDGAAARGEPSVTTASPPGSSPNDADADRSDAGAVRLLSPNTWLAYGMLAVSAVFVPIVYYSQTSSALADLPAIRGTILAQVPTLALFGVVVGFLGVFLVSAIPFLIGRYGVLNPPDAEAVRSRRAPLRILAHLTALSGIAVVAAIGAFVVITGRWPTGYGIAFLQRLLG